MLARLLILEVGCLEIGLGVAMLVLVALVCLSHHALSPSRVGPFGAFRRYGSAMVTGALVCSALRGVGDGSGL